MLTRIMLNETVMSQIKAILVTRKNREEGETAKKIRKEGKK